MPDEFKRHIAYKQRIGNILTGKPVLENERFRFLEIGDKKVVRINIIGNIIDKYVSEGEKKYTFFTLDDGSGQIKLKSFEEVPKFNNINQGQTVLVIGVLRYWNNELYINPEIIKEQDPKYLMVRKTEMEKQQKENSVSVGKDEIVAVKDKIIKIIKESEEQGGIDTDEIILKLGEISPEVIKQEVQKLIGEGMVFEPKPGRVRYLG